MSNSLSPFSYFCDDILYITSSAFFLSLPELPDPSLSRDDIYLDASASLNVLHDKGWIDDTFFYYLSDHLEYAYGTEVL